MRSEFASRVPNGSVLFRSPELPLVRLQPLALKILTSLQALSPGSQKVKLVEDWLDHDGMEFAKGMQPLAFLFSLAETPRSLFEGTPKDQSVFLRAEADDGAWVFRVRTDWDDDDRKQIGEIHLAVSAAFAPQLEASLEGQIREGSLSLDEKRG